MIIPLGILLFVTLLLTPRILSGIFTDCDLHTPSIALWSFCLTMFIVLKWL